MISIAVSACLLGEKCRYDGKSNQNERVIALGKKALLVPVCPEVAGGLPTPRPCAEIKDGRVVTQDGSDVTQQFEAGAMACLGCAKAQGCRAAVLKARSPSCGAGEIYDGSFSHSVIKGNGVFAGLLEKAGIRVFTEEQVDELEACLSNGRHESSWRQEIR